MHHHHLSATGAHATRPFEQALRASSISAAPPPKVCGDGRDAVTIREAERRFWQSLSDGTGHWSAGAQAATLWRGVLEGRWVVAGAARSPGLYAAVARQTRPSERHAAMSARSREVLERGLRGIAQKAIALDRSQPTTPSAVSQAVKLELERLGLRSRRELVGSSRVDLQACKLEYSIVSPK